MVVQTFAMEPLARRLSAFRLFGRTAPSLGTASALTESFHDVAFNSADEMKIGLMVIVSAVLADDFHVFTDTRRYGGRAISAAWSSQSEGSRPIQPYFKA